MAREIVTLTMLIWSSNLIEIRAQILRVSQGFYGRRVMKREEKWGKWKRTHQWLRNWSMGSWEWVWEMEALRVWVLDYLDFFYFFLFSKLKMLFKQVGLHFGLLFRSLIGMYCHCNFFWAMLYGAKNSSTNSNEFKFNQSKNEKTVKIGKRDKIREREHTRTTWLRNSFRTSEQFSFFILLTNYKS